MNTPIRVAVTGAAGQIGYALLFRIASGSMFGPDQPVILHLIEIEPGMAALQGMVRELEDGGLILSAKVGHPNQVLPIVRYWIPNIHIISPEGLQAEMNLELLAYTGGNTTT